MGVIIDSSVAIATARARESPFQALERIRLLVGDQPVALSAIGYTELVHGIYRGPTNAHRLVSRAFVETFVADLPVYPYTRETAELAGRIDAEQRIEGFHIPFSDLLIGATALQLDFAVLTTNLRHFRLIPGLEVIAF
jgi:predicted nucleic acid-binding protein